MLDDLFSEYFPELEQMEFKRVIGNSDIVNTKSYQKTPGYVYLIESEYGFKIGKTVNIKSRTSLFSVKLPFPIKLINYAWFDNYSKAERDFHVEFADKRLEGEWFALTGADVSKIKSLGKNVPVEGL
ncbi:MAG: GIY-YIG nuclease family protein [Cognaticolwellia sp.]